MITPQNSDAAATSPPALTGLVPNQGPTAGGTTVTLTGTNLSDATAVNLGTTPAAFTVVSATQITATTPAGPAGAAQVTVTTPAGTSGGLAYYYRLAPAVTNLAPGQGSTAGGTTVVLTGTNLSGATAVNFGTTPVAFAVNSDSQITATAPAGPAGPAQVTVITPGGTSTGLSYFLVNAPAVTNLAPNQGPTTGGTAVTLTGTSLLNATAVNFGTTPAAFTVASATQITATAPARTAGAAQVTVTTPAGTSPGLPYTFVNAPTLTALAPNQGPSTGGTTVTLTGTNLNGATAVNFGTTPAAFTVVSTTQITATTPAGPAGATQVTVTTPAGTGPGLTYTRVSSPGI